MASQLDIADNDEAAAGLLDLAAVIAVQNHIDIETWMQMCMTAYKEVPDGMFAGVFVEVPEGPDT
jgi:hypothetical protein